MTIELLQKLKENRCTDEELHQIYSWLCTSQNEEETAAFLKNSWQGLSASPQSGEDMASVKRMRHVIWERIEDQNSRFNTNGGAQLQVEKPRKKTLWRQWSSVAAVLVLFTVIGAVFLTIDSQRVEEHVNSVTYIEKSNPRGQKSTVFLKDGSKVILNSSSSIRYASNFGETHRDIELIGEAFFEVAKNKDVPFNVISGDITTRALGTSFNIKAYPQQEEVKVSLFTGKTKVFFNDKKDNEQEEGYILDPGQSLSFNSKMRLFEKGQFDSRKVLSWKDGILYFENEKFDNVVSILEEWYDVDITVDYGQMDKSAYDGINGEFKNESLENVMRVMNHSRDFEYTLKGKQVKIRFN